MIPVIRNRSIGGGANGRNSAFFVDVDTRFHIPATPDILAQELAEWGWHWSRGWILSRGIGMVSARRKLAVNAYGMAVTCAFVGWNDSTARRLAGILSAAYAKDRVSPKACLAMMEAARPDAEAWVRANRARVEREWARIT